MKRILAVVIALVIIVSLCASAIAEEGAPQGGPGGMPPEGMAQGEPPQGGPGGEPPQGGPGGPGDNPPDGAPGDAPGGQQSQVEGQLGSWSLGGTDADSIGGDDYAYDAALYITEEGIDTEKSETDRMCFVPRTASLCPRRLSSASGVA